MPSDLTRGQAIPAPLVAALRLPGAGALAWWTALGVLSALLLAPLLVVDVPPLLDYPNHLARAVILAFPADPSLARLAVPHWIITPNLGLDLLLPPMLHAFPVHVAGRILIAAALLLPVLGSIAYSRAVFGQRCWWPLGAVLVAWNQTMLLGFLNFMLAVGLALLLAAVWIRWRAARPVPVVVFSACGAAGLFLCHLAGLVLFALLVGAWEIAQLHALRREPARVLTRLLILAGVMAPACVLYALSPLAGEREAIVWSSPLDKLRQLLVPFANYNLPLDIVTAIAVVALPIGLYCARRLGIGRSAGLAIALLAGLYLVTPFGAKGAYSCDTRFIAMLGLMLFAGLRPLRLSRRSATVIAGTLLTLFTLRTGVVLQAWSGHARDLRELRAVMAAVPAGTAVMVASVAPAEAPDYWRATRAARWLSNGLRTDPHMAALLVIERHAFWPFLFDNPTQQPVRWQPRYHALAEQVGGLPDHRALLRPGRVDLCGYQALLLLDAGGEPDLAGFAADRLRLVRHSDFAALYRMRSTACDPDPSGKDDRPAADLLIGRHPRTPL